MQQVGVQCQLYNAANEQAVALFLEEKIQFLDIPRCIEWCAIATSDNRPTPWMTSWINIGFDSKLISQSEDTF